MIMTEPMLYVGIAATTSFFFLAYLTWECVRTYVTQYVRQEISELRTDIERDIEDRQRSVYETVEYNSRSAEERFNEIERSINNEVSMISE